MKTDIIKLRPEDFEKCSNIWDMDEIRGLADRFYNELKEGNRSTYIYRIDGEYIGEISTLKDSGDPDYTLPERRLYLSRLIVKDGYRRQGIGKKLLEFAVSKAKDDGYEELSVGVDLNNYPALKLYADSGFDKIIFTGEDEYGRFFKLLKYL